MTIIGIVEGQSLGSLEFTGVAVLPAFLSYYTHGQVYPDGGHGMASPSFYHGYWKTGIRFWGGPPLPLARPLTSFFSFARLLACFLFFFRTGGQAVFCARGAPGFIGPTQPPCKTFLKLFVRPDQPGVCRAITGSRKPFGKVPPCYDVTN